METKTKIVKLRVTLSHYNDIKRRSKTFGSMTNLVNQALKEFSDATAKDKLEVSRNLAQKYADLDTKLAHVGGNLNQAMRKINESAKVDLPYYRQLIDLMPHVKACYDVCNEVRNTLKEVTYKVAKN